MEFSKIKQKMEYSALRGEWGAALVGVYCVSRVLRAQWLHLPGRPHPDAGLEMCMVCLTSAWVLGIQTQVLRPQFLFFFLPRWGLCVAPTVLPTAL